MKLSLSAFTALSIASLATVPCAFAGTAIVNGTASVYSYSTDSTSTSPVLINVSGLTSISFGVTGMVVLNIGSGTNYNDADGGASAPSTSSNTGTSSYAGITAPEAGYLTGIFSYSGDTTPGSATNYLTTLSESSSSFSPTLNQAFFIGDGLTGDGTGSTQTFYVPTGATELFLGISDACGYNGTPSCYGDNDGFFNVTYSTVGSVVTGVSATPEPSSLILLGTGLAGGLAAFRRRIGR